VSLCDGNQTNLKKYAVVKVSTTMCEEWHTGAVRGTHLVNAMFNGNIRE